MKKNKSINPRDNLTALRKRVAMLEKSEKHWKELVDHLTREQTLFHAILDNIPDHIYFKDVDCRIVKVNKAWANHKKLSDPRDAIGMSDFDFFDEKFAQQTFEEEQQIMRTVKPLIGKIEHLKMENGRILWFLATKVPVVDTNGNVIGTCGITRDINDVKSAEDSLEQERNLLRTLIDAVPDYIFVKDAQSRFVVNNKAHLGILGAASQADVAGKTDMDIFPHDLAARYFSDEQVVLQIGKSIVGREEPATGRDGKQKWLSTTKVPVRSADNTITGLVGISHDITERKRFEADLKKAKDELEIRVEERTLDLKTANERLASRIDQLRFLNTTSFKLAQFIRIKDLGTAIIDAFVSRFSTAQCALCLMQDQGFALLSSTSGFSGLAAHPAAQQFFSEFCIADFQQPIIIEDWTTDKRIASYALPGIDGLPCFIAMPFLADNKTIAVILFFTTDDFMKRYEAEVPVLTTLATHAAACLTNALNFQELGKRARLRGELDAARLIQQRFTPRETPPIPRIRVKGVYFPANEVGGDYLDYFQTDDGNWVIAIADVCGKGIPAALFMIMLRSAFRIVGRHAESAKALLCAVNDTMTLNLDEKSFVTVLCLVINKEGTFMTYARAGHPMLLELRGDVLGPKNVECKGVALGLVGDSATFARLLDEVTIPLESGSRFLIYTDGLTEATDPDKNSYGSQRLFDLLAGPGAPDSESLVMKIMADIKDFTRGSPYHDDLTILAMEVIENSATASEKML
jgi:PAS domain S-box-containing protein